jgi:hypothetical protein
VHVFEDLEKEDLISKNKAPKSRRKRNARTPGSSYRESSLRKQL